MVRFSHLAAAAVGLLAHQVSAALPSLDVDSNESIDKIAALVAEDLLSFYPIGPGWTVGILPGPPPDGEYYWWQGGAMWGTYLDYRHHTGDKSYDQYITPAMINQAGPNHDFLQKNWSASMGNDDQAFWALSAMLAAETVYPNPSNETGVDWVALVQAVFNQQSMQERRAPEDSACDWGLRWQVYPSNNGFDYINTIANACYYNLGARLARYTGNTTYADYADRTYDLLKHLKYISDDYDVYDGAHLPDKCTKINKAQFSYNAALLMQGLAFLYDMTKNQTYFTELDKMVDRSLELFFPGGVAFEPSCETGACNVDMMSYKGYLHRWMGSVMQIVPELKNKILPKLKTSTQAAVKQCTGGDNGRMCGFKWKSGTYDGSTGAGQQMNVLGALMSIQSHNADPPVTQDTGGTSQGDAGAGSSQGNPDIVYAPIDTGDKAGAGILTVLIIAATGSAFAWMGID